MDDLKQAYKRMGLPENASKEELDKRYTILMRQARSRQQQPSAQDQGDPAAEFDEVTRAYRFILDYEDRVAAEEFNQKEYGKYKKMAGSAAKLDHFWRYYKLHVFGGILALALIIYGVNSFMDHRAEQARLASLPPIDLSVMYFGEYFIDDGQGGGTGTNEQLEAALLEQFPEWKRFNLNLTYVPLETKDQMDMASQQKAMIVLMTEKPDVYILDTASFNWIAPQGVLLNLDDVATGKVKEALGTDKAIKQKTDDDPAEHVYGIDISKSSIIGKLPALARNNFIVGIRVTSEKVDNGLYFIDKFLQNE